LGMSTQMQPGSWARACTRPHRLGELGALGHEHPDAAWKLGKERIGTIFFYSL